MDKTISDARVYTDVQSLEHLKYTASHNPRAAKNEIAKQFESLLLQQMLKSMRDANKVFDNDLFSSDQMDFYQDMYDKQLTLSLSEHGLGITEMISKNIEDHYQNLKPDGDEEKVTANVQESKSNIIPLVLPKTDSMPKEKITSNAQLSITKVEKKVQPIQSPEDFIDRLWQYAKDAAKKIGVNPKVLLAQAALETNWGKNMLAGSAQQSSHNLFNIKAGINWDKPTSTAMVLEERNGVMVSEKSKFRNYDSYADSFHDYVSLLTSQNRYRDVIKNASNPREYVVALQQSGFATDQHYAEKVLGVFSSSLFKKLTDHLVEN